MSWASLSAWRDLPRTNEAEKIDDPAQPFPEIERSMRDVALSNRLFGGTQTVLYHVAKILRNVPKDTEVRILDIATGSGDIPLALAEWGRKEGRQLTIIALDNHAAMLRMAQAAAPKIPLVQANALALPFAPGSFDIALCALAFHHFGYEMSIQVLKAMDRLTTHGFVVTDLRRDLPTLWGIKAVFAALQAHAFTRHDAPTSVRRAFTPSEYRKMVGQSGVQNVRLRIHCYFRVALVQDKSKLDRQS